MSVGDGPATDNAVARSQAVQRLLEREGLDATVSVAGRDGEIAAIRGNEGLRARLAELAPEIRAFGFSYVALELGYGTDQKRL